MSEFHKKEVKMKTKIFIAILTAILFSACSETTDDIKCAAGDNKACAKSIDRDIDRGYEIMKHSKHMKDLF